MPSQHRGRSLAPVAVADQNTQFKISCRVTCVPRYTQSNQSGLEAASETARPAFWRVGEQRLLQNVELPAHPHATRAARERTAAAGFHSRESWCLNGRAPDRRAHLAGCQKYLCQRIGNRARAFGKLPLRCLKSGHSEGAPPRPRCSTRSSSWRSAGRWAPSGSPRTWTASCGSSRLPRRMSPWLSVSARPNGARHLTTTILPLTILWAARVETRALRVRRPARRPAEHHRGHPPLRPGNVTCEPVDTVDTPPEFPRP